MKEGKVVHVGSHQAHPSPENLSIRVSQLAQLALRLQCPQSTMLRAMSVGTPFYQML